MCILPCLNHNFNLPPTPTLQDLLNPELTNDNSLTDDDPYRATFLNDNNDNNDTLIMITRSRILEHLEIDPMVNLTKPKLIAHFDEQPPTPSAPKTSVAQAPPKMSQKWSAANSEWATKAFTF